MGEVGTSSGWLGGAGQCQCLWGTRVSVVTKHYGHVDILPARDGPPGHRSCVCCHPVLPSPESFCPTRKHMLHSHIRAFCKHFPVGSGALRRAEGTRNGSYHVDPSCVGPQCGSPHLQCSGDVLRRSLTWNPPAGLGQPGHQPPESRHCFCGLHAHYPPHGRCACRLGTV